MHIFYVIYLILLALKTFIYTFIWSNRLLLLFFNPVLFSLLKANNTPRMKKLKQ